MCPLHPTQLSANPCKPPLVRSKGPGPRLGPPCAISAMCCSPGACALNCRQSRGPECRPVSRAGAAGNCGPSTHPIIKVTKKIESGPFETLRLEGRHTFCVVKFPGTVIRRKGDCGEGYSYAIASPGDQCVVCEWVTTHPGLRRSCQSVGGMASLNSLS